MTGGLGGQDQSLELDVGMLGFRDSQKLSVMHDLEEEARILFGAMCGSYRSRIVVEWPYTFIYNYSPWSHEAVTLSARSLFFGYIQPGASAW